MAYLLDTHIVLWLANEPEQLTYEVQNLLMNKNERIYFSSVNIWEMAIKKKVRTDFQVDIPKLHRHLLIMQYQELPVLAKHCYLVEHLPKIHNDPFDRLLISQAMSENLTLITHDTSILKYDNVKLLKA